MRMMNLEKKFFSYRIISVVFAYFLGFSLSFGSVFSLEYFVFEISEYSYTEFVVSNILTIGVFLILLYISSSIFYLFGQNSKILSISSIIGALFAVATGVGTYQTEHLRVIPEIAFVILFIFSVVAILIISMALIILMYIKKYIHGIYLKIVTPLGK